MELKEMKFTELLDIYLSCNERLKFTTNPDVHQELTAYRTEVAAEIDSRVPGAPSVTTAKKSPKAATE